MEVYVLDGKIIMLIMLRHIIVEFESIKHLKENRICRPVTHKCQ